MIIKNLLISEKCFYLGKTLSLNLQKILALTGYNTTFTGAQQLGGQGGHGPLHLNFRTKQGPSVSVSNIRDNAFYGCSQIIRTKNFAILPSMLQYLNNLRHLFIFSNCIGEIDHFTLDLLKRSDS